MGDISGRPKAPAPQVVYVPRYVYNNDTGSDSGSTPDETPTPEAQREKNLLERQRGRFGTILTGFRGILSPTETQNTRKTLLGE